MAFYTKMLRVYCYFLQRIAFYINLLFIYAWSLIHA